MKTALVLAPLVLCACSPQLGGSATEISCKFTNAGSMLVAADVKSAVPVPPEARDPVSFTLEGKISGDRFDGAVSGLQSPGSDLIYQEKVQGRFDAAASALIFSTKDDKWRFSVWPHSDLPDQEGSRAIWIGEKMDMEAISYFVGGCGSG